MLFQKILEGEKYVTVSLVPYAIFQIRTELTAFIATTEANAITARQKPVDMQTQYFDNSNPPEEQQAEQEHKEDKEITGILELARKMLQDFNLRWGNGLNVWIENESRGPRQRQKGLPKSVLISAALDPRTFSLVGIPVADREHIWKAIAIKLQRVSSMSRLQATSSTFSSEPTRGTQTSLFESLYVHSDDIQPLPVEEAVDNEIATFRRESQIKVEDENGEFNNPLEWWKTREQQYPLMSKLARQYLCCPATSAPSERIFSSAGLTITAKRTRLKPQHASSLVFLHNYCKRFVSLESRYVDSASESESDDEDPQDTAIV
ncbi:MAG: hAT family dimerization domain-containing protein [Bacteroidota bacterium]